MRALIIATAFAAGSVAVMGQSSIDGRTEVQLERLFPTATSFSPKVPTPPHYKAYAAGASGQPTLLGIAFWTTELEPLEHGYDGPIPILVGMTMNGILTGVVV